MLLIVDTETGELAKVVGTVEQAETGELTPEEGVVVIDAVMGKLAEGIETEEDARELSKVLMAAMMKAGEPA